MELRNKDYLLNKLPNELRKLSGDREPNFGLMTAQHMVEHLIWSSKMYYRQGEPTDESPSKSQVYFQGFVRKNCPFEYRPKEGASKADLRALKYDSFEKAIKALEEVNADFYSLAKENPNHMSYSPMTGEFNIELLDTFLGQHARWHSFQFGLLDEYVVPA